MKNAKLIYNTDAGDRLTALTSAMGYIEDAMDEIRGIGEFDDLFTALDNDLSVAEGMKDETESYITGEYQAQRAELAREYYRGVM